VFRYQPSRDCSVVAVFWWENVVGDVVVDGSELLAPHISVIGGLLLLLFDLVAFVAKVGVLSGDRIDAAVVCCLAC
jgi:hypothetical protein